MYAVIQGISVESRHILNSNSRLIILRQPATKYNVLRGFREIKERFVYSEAEDVG